MKIMKNIKYVEFSNRKYYEIFQNMKVLKPIALVVE